MIPPINLSEPPVPSVTKTTNKIDKTHSPVSLNTMEKYTAMENDKPQPKIPTLLKMMGG